MFRAVTSMLAADPHPSVQTALSLWLEICSRQLLTGDVAEGRWRDFLDNYCEPHRHYHNMQHLEHLAKLYREVCDEMKNPTAIAFALFWVGVVFDPRKEDNYDRSAVQWVDWTKVYEEHFPRDFVDQVVSLIRYSRPFIHALPSDAGSDLFLFLDLQNEVFAQTRDDYFRYLTDIEREYSHLKRKEYVLFRTEVLGRYLAQPFFYRSEYFRTRYEDRARANMKWEAALLKGPTLTQTKWTIGDRAEVMEFEKKHRSDVPMRLSEDQVRHALALGMDLCYAHRDLHKGKIIAAIIGTLTNTEQSYATELRTEHEFSGDHLLIHTALVHEKHRSRGLMTDMMREYLHHIRMHKPGVKQVSILVPQTSMGFFERFGFQAVKYGTLQGPKALIEPPIPAAPTPRAVPSSAGSEHSSSDILGATAPGGDAAGNGTPTQGAGLSPKADGTGTFLPASLVPSCAATPQELSLGRPGSSRAPSMCGSYARSPSAASLLAPANLLGESTLRSPRAAGRTPGASQLNAPPPSTPVVEMSMSMKSNSV